MWLNSHLYLQLQLCLLFLSFNHSGPELDEDDEDDGGGEFTSFLSTGEGEDCYFKLINNPNCEFR